MPNYQKELYGVGGWLLLFCLGMTIFDPLILLGAALGSKNALVIAVNLGLAALSFYTGIGLWRVSLNCFKWLKICFVVELILGALGILYSIQAEAGPLASKSSMSALSNGIGNIASVAIWWSYFKVSKRVRATYGTNLYLFTNVERLASETYGQGPSTPIPIYGQAPSTPIPSVEGIPTARRRAVAAPSRSPAQVLFRLLGVILILAGILLIVFVGTGAFLTYRIVTARNDTESVTPASYLLSNSENLNFNDPAGGEHEGWLLRGQKGSPVIFLCHGYNSNKSDLLSLGTVLQGRNHFNVYVFNFYGPKVKSNYSDLGVREAADLIAAIETVTQQPGVNPRRVGLFGVTTGGYAALAAAEQSNLVKAVAVDSAYDDPREMFEAQMASLLGGSRRLSRILSRTEFRVLNLSGKAPHIREDLQKLGDMPKLFISARDTPSLAAVTEDLWKSAPEPKRLLPFEHSQAALTSGAEKKEYENQVLTFFLQNLPLGAD